MDSVKDYGMSHRPPSTKDDGAPLHDLTENGTYPADVYDKPSWYDGGEEDFWEAWRSVAAKRGKPNSRVSIYRAMPCDRKELNTGDWVTTVKRYARMEGKHPSDPSKDMCVRTAYVPARCLRTDGNSLLEWGYACEPKKKLPTVFRRRKKRG